MTAQRKYATTSEAEIRRHLAQGLTIGETAQALGVSPRMLHHCCSVLGLKSHGRYHPRQLSARAHAPFGLSA